jgi:hypothetical protein
LKAAERLAQDAFVERHPLGRAHIARDEFLRLGHVLSYRFLKTGRYLVICMNRSHFLNDWMSGFVNVVGGNN